MVETAGGRALPPDFRLVYLAEAGSTNDEAARLALSGAEEFTLVQAGCQTGGRGRQGRVWDSPPGNLYQSLILRPRRPASEIAQLSLIAGLALAEAVAGVIGHGGQHVAVKWPNDVLIGDAKVAGLLLEAQIGGTGLADHVILGTGVNITHHPDGTPYPATHVTAHAPQASLGAVQAGFCDAFRRWYNRWQAEGLAAVRDAWLTRAWRLGETVRLRPGEQTITGRFLGIDGRGAMLLETADGVQQFTAGDMFGLEG